MPRDIIVTTPKSAIRSAAIEANLVKSGGATHYYRNYRTAPPVEKGSRVYYVEDGYIRGYCLVDYLDVDYVEGKQVEVMMMDAKTWTWIEPIPMVGFQNWRYMKLERNLVKDVGNWLEPMPEINTGN